MSEAMLPGFHISPAAFPCWRWHGDWKRKLSTNLSLATVSTYFTESSFNNFFLKLKQLGSFVCFRTFLKPKNTGKTGF